MATKSLNVFGLIKLSDIGSLVYLFIIIIIIIIKDKWQRAKS